LPSSMSVAVENPGEKMDAKIRFDYPESGPLDVYALGVPRDVRVVDRIPSGEAQKLIEGMQASLDRFDPYFAIHVITRTGSPWFRGTPMLV